MVNRIEIERLLQSKELKELWQTIQQELPQLHFCEENDFWEEARIDNLEDYISECNTLICKCNFQELSTLNPQLHSRSATYIKRNGLLIRKITIKSSRPFQCAYHPLTP